MIYPKMFKLLLSILCNMSEKNVAGLVLGKFLDLTYSIGGCVMWIKNKVDDSYTNIDLEPILVENITILGELSILSQLVSEIIEHHPKKHNFKFRNIKKTVDLILSHGSSNQRIFALLVPVFHKSKLVGFVVLFRPSKYEEDSRYEQLLTLVDSLGIDLAKKNEEFHSMNQLYPKISEAFLSE